MSKRKTLDPSVMPGEDSVRDPDIRGKKKLEYPLGLASGAEIMGKRKALDPSVMPGEDSVRDPAKRQRGVKDDYDIVLVHQRTNLVPVHPKALMISKANVVARVAPPLHSLGMDLLGEILGWLSAEDLAQAASASQYLLAITRMSSFCRLLRTQHSSRQRTGSFLGVVIQRGTQIYLQSPHLNIPLKRAVALVDFLLTESRSRTSFILSDSRDGKLLLSTDIGGRQFLVCSPFEEHCYTWLPVCPLLAPDGEEVVCAAFVPDDRTCGYTVIAVAVKVSDRAVACLKKYVSKADRWSSSIAECSFKFPEQSKLRSASVLSNGHLNILTLTVGIISINIERLIMRIIPLPLQDVLRSVPLRYQIICRNKQGSLCHIAVKVVSGIPGRGKKTVLSVFVFNWISEQWSLRSEWPAPKTIPCLNLLGFAEGNGTAIVGTGWDSLYAVSIDDGSFSNEMRNTGARKELLTYEVEYPSTSWWGFTE